jgi:glycosyltransferase involved in cell wall biosynthesis
MKISIIMATYNANSTLPKAMYSVFSQTQADFELLVTDGGSIDGTIEILKDCKDSRLAWWISEKDNGIYDAWNKALNHIRGEWILFMGADDELWNKSVIENFIESALKIDRKYKIIYGKVAQCCPKGTVWNIAGKPWEQTKKAFRYKSQMFAHQGIFHHYSLFENGNRFDPSFKIAGDYEFLLKALKDQDAYFLPDLIVAKMSYEGASGGYNNFRLLDELISARSKNNLNNRNFWVFSLRFRYWLRSFIANCFGFGISKKLNDYIRLLVGKPKLPT